MSTRTYGAPDRSAVPVGSALPTGTAHDAVGTSAEPAPARRRGLGGVLVVLGAALAALLVAGTALTLVALLVRQEATDRTSYERVGTVRVDASCPGDVSVVADPEMVPGTAEVVWRERWSLLRPSHDGAVRGGTLDLGTTCSRVTIGISAVSEVTVRVAPGVAAAVGTGAGDVVVTGTGAGVDASTGVGDVRVEGAAGAVAVDTGVGDVTVGGSLVRARVDGGTGDVSVTSSVPADLVDVDAGVGDVTVRLPAGDRAYAVDTDTGVGGTRIGVPQDDDAPRRVLVDAGVGDVAVETVP